VREVGERGAQEKRVRKLSVLQKIVAGVIAALGVGLAWLAFDVIQYLLK